ncbi:MAG: hypothetical protein RL323_1761 [Pseudomonadota bacterium]|jgi:hypothetical protein
MAFDIFGAGASLLGGLLGSGSNDNTQAATKSMDPRMDRYVYGPDSQSGLLGGAWNLMQQQAGQGGLNDLQRQGLEMQRQYLMSPQYSQDYETMRNMGAGLMGGGMAGNPFTNGSMGNLFSQPAQQTQQAPAPFAYTGLSNAQLPDFRSIVPQLTQPAPAATPAPSGPSSSSSSGQAQAGTGSASAPGGQGISSDSISSGLGLLALAEKTDNPLLKLIFTTAGNSITDRQINGISGSFDALNNNSADGFGSVSDADGNVRSYTTPAMIAAQDEAMFGPGLTSAPTYSSSSSSYSPYGNNSSSWGPYSGGGDYSGYTTGSYSGDY